MCFVNSIEVEHLWRRCVMPEAVRSLLHFLWDDWFCEACFFWNNGRVNEWCFVRILEWGMIQEAGYLLFQWTGQLEKFCSVPKYLLSVKIRYFCQIFSLRCHVLQLPWMSFRRCCFARDVMLRSILWMFCFVRFRCMDEMVHEDRVLVLEQHNTPDDGKTCSSLEELRVLHEKNLKVWGVNSNNKTFGYVVLEPYVSILFFLKELTSTSITRNLILKMFWGIGQDLKWKISSRTTRRGGKIRF